MTAITAQPTAFGAPRTRLRLTVRGRRVLATLAALPAAVALAWAVIGGGSALASRDAGVAAGGRAIEDPPGERKGPFGPMILAYLRDPDGNKIEAVTFAAT